LDHLRLGSPCRGRLLGSAAGAARAAGGTGGCLGRPGTEPFDRKCHADRARSRGHAAGPPGDYPPGGEPYFGYYQPTDRRMVMNINTGTGTLVHELTHALIVYDFPNVPTWFNEGLASLHEQCSVREETIIGLTNWRLPGLQSALKKGTLRPLRDLVTKRDFYGRLQGDNYAQARYFVMYMQTKGLLREFHKHFRAHHSGRNADVQAIEHVFGRKIGDVEKTFIAWVKTLRFRR
jgi:hypothetical protein